MSIKFEKEVLNYLNLPKIPIKEHDGVTPFEKGVAVVKTIDGDYAYATCSFNPENGDTIPVVTKVFSIVPFVEIEKVFVVPNYMDSVNDVPEMDLDDESKKKAEIILNEAAELENEGVDSETEDINNLPEWIFPEISSKEEAVAWLKNWQIKNRLRQRIPKTEENIKLRLYSIYTELKGKQK